jgi:hypothetical protein
LAQTGHIFLGGKKYFPHPSRLVNAPLQPHPSISNIPLHPQPGPINDGWEENQNKPASGNGNLPNIHKRQLELVVAPISTSTKYIVQNHACIKIKSIGHITHPTNIIFLSLLVYVEGTHSLRYSSLDDNILL